ncbi:hypothetical protein CLOP_g988 [Closterium sp. NIES-67]|nr:hypothetical protein CLOP_g988 [Closterium sp. NIES-67]
MWEWGEEQKLAVADLQTAFKEASVLELPQWDVPYVLYTDWSSAGMGAVLCRVVDGMERVVAFASRSCNASEANYSSYEGEELGAVWAVGHFRVYLQGKHSRWSQTMSLCYG